MEPQAKPIGQTLMERVDLLVQELGSPVEWGHPLSSTTPKAHAIQNLAERTQALEAAVREIAFEVQRLATASASFDTTGSA